ncbi:MAG: hypothetical protein HC850_13735, partial [Rhodomicrobium sp.]|nr:hypothetical protein [Rhodomicrobium sp.]
MADDHKAASASPPIGYPYLKGEVSIEFQYDNVFDADNPDSEISDAYNTTEVAVGAYFNRHFSLQSTLVFEPVLDPGPGEDRFFSDHGLYAEELYAKFDFSPFSLKLGKFNPAFGKAWDVTPGVYGTDLAEDYELTERVGLAVEVAKDKTVAGDVTMTASAFFADTSELSDSVFTERGKISLADGGLSNTEELDSFALAIEGKDIPGLAGLSYNFGYVHQSGGVFDIDDQNGFVAGLQLDKTYNGVALTWIGEVAYFDYAGDFFEDGDFVETLWYYTLGAQAKIDKYNIAIAYTGRNSEQLSGIEHEDYQFQISAGMDLPDGWTVDIGYRLLEEQDEESHTVGVLFAKTIEFDTSAL